MHRLEKLKEILSISLTNSKGTLHVWIRRQWNMTQHQYVMSVDDSASPILVSLLCYFEAKLLPEVDLSSLLLYFFKLAGATL